MREVLHPLKMKAPKTQKRRNHGGKESRAEVKIYRRGVKQDKTKEKGDKE